jgi:hypothetical protein
MSDPGDKKGYQISDLRIALKELEKMVKGRDKKGRLFLIDGNNNPGKTGVIPIIDGTEFKMRYREAWANWLFCAVLNFVSEGDFTFQEDGSGDGIIVNRKNGHWFLVEHVSAMTYDKGQQLPKGEARVLWAINKKIEKDRKNPGYADRKTLIVFLDGAEKWYPNRVGRAIAGTHNFSAVYCIGLWSSESNMYRYTVSDLRPHHSPTYSVEINDDFTDWTVSQLQ